MIEVIERLLAVKERSKRSAIFLIEGLGSGNKKYTIPLWRT
jgi:hypothetical protein